MTVLYIIKALLNDPIIQSYLISCGASASWDAMKLLGKKGDDTLENQLYGVLSETFERFADCMKLEYDEQLVMDSFLHNINNTEDFGNQAKVLSDTLNVSIGNEQLKRWNAIFVEVCSKPKYQWLYNKLSANFEIAKLNDRNYEWMTECMEENFCKIQCEKLQKLPPLFDDIGVELDKTCWYTIKVLIYEIVFNAKEHGKAQKCFVQITKNSIAVFDDGTEFDPQEMKQREECHGGAMALQDVMENYPEIVLKSTYANGLNRFEMIFPNEVFDVNQMSEIVIPDLYYMRGEVQLKYPEGKFRYYFIDIGEIPTGQRGELFATYSGIAVLVEKLQNNIEKLTEDSEIFVRFPNTSRPDYKKVYSMMARVLWGRMMPGKIKISLSPASLETEME
ncbi:hypothetical protein [Faecalibacterium sp. OM04-11BH]|uniref:hypothetical protein n=1 Tax=Faecalibacterium sp. OM04-11BH TaxID=2292357 RepID=UPI000E4D5C14|nr:hypothetical protein [Faecalibacterium sp. OM04-11BH]RHV49725.1 hypothetical protein DXB44_12880 [Faecalibacterium sp. OM04-11BH]